jgi:hypothetical protein
MYILRFGPILYKLTLIYFYETYSFNRPLNYLSNSENRIKIGLKLAELLAQI